MNNEKCVIMFTKNRPETLSKSLPSLINAELSVIVLDDSTNKETQLIIDSISKKGKNIHYHGRQEQMELIQKVAKLGSDPNYFIKPLGINGWNLGYVRNYAIIQAKALGFKQILFMDDDIIIKENNIIQDMMRYLVNADFVGAKISGMPDDSIVGHVMRKLGMHPYEFLSCGFLAFNLDSVSEFFLNYYNEDWIWLFLHKPKAKLVKYREVYQLPYNPFENAAEKALQQEFGEILVEGVKYIIETDKDSSLLINKNTWNLVVKRRIKMIKEIIMRSERNDFQTGITIGNELLELIQNMKVEDFINLFTGYFNGREAWLDIIGSLNGSKTTANCPIRRLYE